MLCVLALYKKRLVPFSFIKYSMNFLLINLTDEKTQKLIQQIIFNYIIAYQDFLFLIPQPTLMPHFELFND